MPIIDKDIIYNIKYRCKKQFKNYISDENNNIIIKQKDIYNLNPNSNFKLDCVCDYCKKEFSISCRNITCNLSTRIQNTGYTILCKSCSVSLSRRTITDEQIQFIKENYANMSEKLIAEKLHLTIPQIACYKKTLNLHRIKSKTPNVWSDEQLQFLLKNYEDKSYQYIATRIGQSKANVRKKVKELNLQISNKRKYDRKNGWAEDDFVYLKKYFPYKSNDELAQHLHHTACSIGSIANRLGLKKIYKVNQWTNEQILFLKNNFNKLALEDISKELNKSISAICNQARRLKLLISKRHTQLGHTQTYPEKLVANILSNLNISYTTETRLIQGRLYRCDFVISNIVIEVNGDYWHGNPQVYTEYNKMQLQNIQRDKEKKQYLEQLGYKVIYIWEYDLMNNINNCIELIKSVIKGDNINGTQNNTNK